MAVSCLPTTFASLRDESPTIYGKSFCFIVALYEWCLFVSIFPLWNRKRKISYNQQWTAKKGSLIWSLVARYYCTMKMDERNRKQERERVWKMANFQGPLKTISNPHKKRSGKLVNLLSVNVSVRRGQGQTKPCFNIVSSLFPPFVNKFYREEIIYILYYNL